MNTKNHVQARPQRSAVTKDITQRIQKLEAAVNNMDAFSQEGYGQISAIAKLALLSLETRGGHSASHIETLAVAFAIIRKIADESENSINFTAEEVGLNHKDRGATTRGMASNKTFEQSNKTTALAQTEVAT